MDKTSLILYTQYAEIFNRLTNEEAGMLIKSIFTYQQTGIKEDLPGAWGMGYFMIVKQLEKDNERWKNTCKLRSEAGRKGGSVSKSKQKLSKAKQSQANQADNEYEYENDNDYEDQKTKDIPQKKTKGKPVLENFNEFWSAYPKKVGKKDAVKAWRKLKPDETLTKTILDGVQKWQASKQWAEDGGRFIPHPATFLNGERWNDECEPAKPVYTPKNYDTGGDFFDDDSGGDID